MASSDCCDLPLPHSPILHVRPRSASHPGNRRESQPRPRHPQGCDRRSRAPDAPHPQWRSSRPRTPQARSARRRAGPHICAPSELARPPQRRRLSRQRCPAACRPTPRRPAHAPPRRQSRRSPRHASGADAARRAASPVTPAHRTRPRPSAPDLNRGRAGGRSGGCAGNLGSTSSDLLYVMRRNVKRQT